MTGTVSRRRFLAISAAAAAVAVAGGTAGAGGPVRWRGNAFGAEASILLSGVGEPAARRLFAAVEGELGRLESLFSLFRRDSQLCELNRAGRIDGPASELVEILHLAGEIHAATGGAFDPSVQPLWEMHAAAAAAGRQPEERQIAAGLARTGWPQVAVSPGRVELARPGMALTLNGIAQGYAADRIAALLRARGMTDVLVDMGEIAALGARPDGGPWRAAIARPDGEPLGQVALADRALATSAPLGTALDLGGRSGHIIDPRTGRPGGRWRLVAVSAPRAAVADALSTAFCLMPRDEIDRALARYPDARIEALI